MDSVRDRVLDIEDEIAALPGEQFTGWTNYACTVSGFTNVTATTARYQSVGRTAHVQVALSFSGAPTVSGNGLQVSLPFSYSSLGAHTPMGHITFLDASASARYEGILIAPNGGSQNTLVARGMGSNGIHQALSATVPFTWASGDSALLDIGITPA